MLEEPQLQAMLNNFYVNICCAGKDIFNEKENEEEEETVMEEIITTDQEIG